MQAETTFPLMGSTTHLYIVGNDTPALLELAQRRLVDLERRWTRFSPESELAHLNDKAGHPTLVSPDTYRLIDTAITSWHQTGGRYDPSLLHDITNLGYDRTFDIIDRTTAQPNHVTPTRHRSRVADIDLDPQSRLVTLPPGLGLDPGGIGKGLAGDIVAEELLHAGATGVMVNIGGDVRVAGTPPTIDQWPISVTDPANPDSEILRIEIPVGAVATSSRLKRHWIGPDGQPVHHLLDPATGYPIDNEIASVTVIAAEGWWAEALTKALFSAGLDTGLDLLQNASGLIVDLDGNHHHTPDLKPALR